MRRWLILGLFMGLFTTNCSDESLVGVETDDGPFATETFVMPSMGEGSEGAEEEALTMATTGDDMVLFMGLGDFTDDPTSATIDCVDPVGNLVPGVALPVVAHAAGRVFYLDYFTGGLTRDRCVINADGTVTQEGRWFFTSTKHGDEIWGSITATVSLQDGAFKHQNAVTGGTGRFTGATGWVRGFGKANLEAGTARFYSKGLISRPDEAADQARVTGSADLLVVRGVTVDADGNTVIPVAADPATLLYYRGTGEPVLAPDGHHVTAGEFSAVQGSISVKCLNAGTQVKLHLRELIPHAIYRIWLLTFKEPGFEIGPPPDFSNLIGEGALGPNDRSRNWFKASASGEGQITRIHPAGLLSETLPAPPFANEPAGDCLLTDEFEWHVVAAFQQPGQPYGPDIGTPALFPGTAVEQFVFIFRQ